MAKSPYKLWTVSTVATSAMSVTLSKGSDNAESKTSNGFDWTTSPVNTDVETTSETASETIDSASLVSCASKPGIGTTPSINAKPKIATAMAAHVLFGTFLPAHMAINGTEITVNDEMNDADDASVISKPTA